MASRPDLAPLGPPLTGASSRCKSRSLQSWCSLRISVGELVVRSNQALPFSIPSISPLDTASTSGGSGSEVKTTFDCAASNLGLSAHLAPALRCGFAESWRMSMHDELVNSLLKIGRHAGAHDPQSDETHLHVGSLLIAFLRLATHELAVGLCLPDLRVSRSPALKAGR